MLKMFYPSTYHFFGTPFILIKDYAEEPSYSYSYPYLTINIPFSAKRLEARRLFHKLAVQSLKKILMPFLKKQINDIGYPLSYSSVKIVDKEWTWGTCSYKGTISFALRLFLAPVPVIRYVIVHELAHLRYKNHSKYFWKEVERYEPDYKYYDKWINKNGHLLMQLKNIK